MPKKLKCKKKNESSKKKKNENKIFSELKNVRTKSMPVSDSVSVTHGQDLVNVRVR